MAIISAMPSARPTAVRPAAPRVVDPVAAIRARPASSDGSNSAKMAAASITPAAKAMKADSCRLFSRSTRNTGKAPTAVASAASREACTPAVMPLLAPVASHHRREGAQKVLPAASPAIMDRPTPSASKALRRACGGTGSSSCCICSQTGRTWRMRAVMAGSLGRNREWLIVCQKLSIAGIRLS